jgi:hypothetical protein
MSGAIIRSTNARTTIDVEDAHFTLFIGGEDENDLRSIARTSRSSLKSTA